MILLIVYTHNNTPGPMVQVICTMEVIQNEKIALWAAMIFTALWCYGYHCTALQRQCMTINIRHNNHISCILYMYVIIIIHVYTCTPLYVGICINYNPCIISHSNNMCMYLISGNRIVV